MAFADTISVTITLRFLFCICCFLCDSRFLYSLAEYSRGLRAIFFSGVRYILFDKPHELIIIIINKADNNFLKKIMRLHLKIEVWAEVVILQNPHLCKLIFKKTKK